MSKNRGATKGKRGLLGLIPLSVTILYLAAPFVLLPQLARCHPSRHAQSVIRLGYPFLRFASDNVYKDYWLEKLNEHIRQADMTCPDRNTHIDSP